MANLTISLDESLIRQARLCAIAQGTSVSAKVREFLLQFVAKQTISSIEQPASELERLMANMRLEVAQKKTDPQPHAAPGVGQGRPTLREEMYGADFRAHSRASSRLASDTTSEPTTQTSHRKRPIGQARA
jgi:plasmid stability protein